MRVVESAAAWTDINDIGKPTLSSYYFSLYDLRQIQTEPIGDANTPELPIYHTFTLFSGAVYIPSPSFTSG